jgi:ribosomal protein S18 acetylase RimI-like enzyme
MQQLIIDEYRAGDEERLRAIAPRAFGVWARYGIDYSLPRPKVEEEYRAEVQGYADRVRRGDPHLAMFVARLAGMVVGYVVVGLDDYRSKRFGLRWGNLISLAVDPDYHHRGIGKALVARAVEWFRAQGCQYVEVTTDQNNIAAIRTYEGAGFRTIYASLTLSMRLP